MTRSQASWIAFTALGLAGAVTAARLFSVALPNISIDITMDRGEALRRAAELATAYGWGSPEDRSAASFGVADAEVQTYVELEGGGRGVFTRLAERGVYQPFQWRVRRFAEGRVPETLVRFTPRGEPYGFRVALSEDDPGDGNQDSGAARASAEAVAAEWNVELDRYRLLESSQETLPSGRLDHEFVFERVDQAVADGRFRLRLRVAGSRVTALTHFVYVPEAFSRRYADMRATNDSIALGSQTAFMVLFVLLGAGVGSALLLRRAWLEWRTALVWGAVIALLFGLNTVNQLPLAWMAYDTALSATSFVLQRVGGALALALLGTPVVAFFVLAGESLGRRAFPDHLQQWRFWSPEVASSRTALGMTAAAYLLVGIQLGYVVLFYLGTQRLEGWWSPADALVQPDLLATYMPWLQAVSLALFASFWEESVFRAVPIACAALLGARYGRRKLWIWTAVALQAVIFAAAHANYPQQPPYARVIELTGPALVWGIVYVRYGLVPTILAHFLYDLSLISVVLFESRALLNQGVIVAVSLVPLGVVLAARVRGRARATPPEWAFNRAWRPRVLHPHVEAGEHGLAPAAGDAGAGEATPGTEASRPTAGREWTIAAWSVPLAAGVGAVLWLGTQLATPRPPHLWGGRDAAEAIALGELGARGAPVDRWSVHASVTAGPVEGREYVYEEAGAEEYAAMSGVYFDVPRWIIRLVDWGGDPEDRVEEYRVWVGDGGVVSRIRHVLPEARAGALIEPDSARQLAYAAASNQLGLERSSLREVEAEETSLPNRTDWTFTFSEAQRLSDVEGEARVQVRLAGDEVVDVLRSVRVPEDWIRDRRNTESRRLIMVGGLVLLLAVCFGAAAVTGVVEWSRGALAPRVTSRLAAPVLLGLAGSAVNTWTATTAGFTTAQPWGLQAGTVAIARALAGLVAAAAIGLVGALALTWLRGTAGRRAPRGSALAFGLLLGGLAFAAERAFASLPRLRDYSGAAASIPPLAEPLAVITPYLLMTVVVLMIIAAWIRFSGHPLAQAFVATILVVAAIVFVPSSLQTSLLSWGLAAIATATLFLAVLRVGSADPGLIPGVVGTVVVLQALTLVWEAPYAGARIAGLLTVPVVVALAWGFARELTRCRDA